MSDKKQPRYFVHGKPAGSKKLYEEAIRGYSQEFNDAFDHDSGLSRIAAMVTPSQAYDLRHKVFIGWDLHSRVYQEKDYAGTYGGYIKIEEPTSQPKSRWPAIWATLAILAAIPLTLHIIWALTK